MMGWVEKHAQGLQAIGALLTALLALVALLGVRWQLDSQEDIAQRQLAQGLYRDYLALSIARPDLADPGQCPQFDAAQATSYDAYIEYTLYTAEQVTSLDPDWNSVFEELLAGHAGWFCGASDWQGYTPPVQAIIARTQAQFCPLSPACAGE